MDIKIFIIEALIFAGLFTVLVFATLKDKETPASIHNYPPDIQEEYFRTHEKIDVGYRSKKVILTKSFGILLFTFVLYLCARFCNARTFMDGFLIGLGLMLWIGIYDTFFIDWVLFANLKCFRLPGTEHMDEAYHQKWFHL